MDEKITICDGKYTLVYNHENGDFRALRYGKEWRDLIGDKLIFALFCEIRAAQPCVEPTGLAATPDERASNSSASGSR